MRCKFICLIALLSAAATSAQQKQTANDSLPATIDSAPSRWSYEAEAYYYILPGQENITTLLGYADYKALHLEARYNYEDAKTASVFAGYRFEAGHKLTLGLTPMLGFAFGNINGIIPALKADLGWKKLDFYAESEYVVDFEGKENNYFYTWAELAISPFNNFRTGISANRTRLYQTGLDLQRGVFAQYSFWKITAGLHYFNPFTGDAFVIATASIEF